MAEDWKFTSGKVKLKRDFGSGILAQLSTEALHLEQVRLLLNTETPHLFSLVQLWILADRLPLLKQDTMKRWVPTQPVWGEDYQDDQPPCFAQDCCGFSTKVTCPGELQSRMAGDSRPTCGQAPSLNTKLPISFLCHPLKTERGSQALPNIWGKTNINANKQKKGNNKNSNNARSQRTL